jgi:hypothetical protein
MRLNTASAGLPGTGSALLVLAGCGDDARAPLEVGSDDPLNCSIPTSEIFNGGPGKDGIPALSNPELAGHGEPGTEYLVDQDRVVGLVLEDEVIAIPLNIFWWHEIVNLDLGNRSVAVTHCPLTGSSMAFDRGGVGGAEFGVSGLLYQNNLILHNRNAKESLWPQMLRGARCGDLTGTELAMVPVVEMTWGGMHDLLSARQGEWTETKELDDTLQGYAEELGLHRGRFEECLDEDHGKERTKRANRAAKVLEVRATPTFFIDGFRVQGALSVEAFLALLGGASAPGSR